MTESPRPDDPDGEAEGPPANAQGSPPPTARERARLALNAFDGWVASRSDWLMSGWVFCATVIVYFGAHAVLRSLLLPGGGIDDATQLYFAQSFALGYEGSHPPLLTWMLLGVQTLSGVSLSTWLGLKFALLALGFLLLYGAARGATTDARFAVAAALTPLATWPVGWEALHVHSHGILAMAASAASFWMLLRLARSRAIVWYVLLGFALGAGFQASALFGLFALALLLAGLTDPVLRRRLLAPRMVIALVLALAAVAPWLVWLAGPPLGFAEGPEVATVVAAVGLETRSAAVWQTIRYLALFYLPLLFVLAVLLTREWRARLVSLVEGTAAEQAWRGQRLLSSFAAIFLALLLVLGLLGAPAALLREGGFLLVIAPLWIFARASLIERGPLHLQRFVVLVLALCLLSSAGAVLRIFVEPLDGKRYASFNVPYAALATQLRDAGFEAGTVFVHDGVYPVAGNLRPYMPDARILSSRPGAYRPPPREVAGQCLVVVSAHPLALGFDGSLEDLLSSESVDREQPMSSGIAEAPLAYGWGRTVALAYGLFDPKTQSCR